MERTRRGDLERGDLSPLSRSATCRRTRRDKSRGEKAPTSRRTSGGARSPRVPVRSSRKIALGLALLLPALLVYGCRQKEPSPTESTGTARELFDRTTRAFHAPSAEARGAERERLLNDAAKGYSELLQRFPAETNLCAQSLRALGSIHATQGKTNEAVKLYAAVGDKYATQDWEVLMAWKAAADLLWEANRRAEAKSFYAKIIERFGKSDAPQIIQQVVRGSKTRLTE